MRLFIRIHHENRTAFLGLDCDVFIISIIEVYSKISHSVVENPSRIGNREGKELSSRAVNDIARVAKLNNK